MNRRTIFALSLLIPLLDHQIACGESIVTQLKSGDSDIRGHAFTIRTSDDGPLVHFEFMVRWTGDAKPSPLLESELEVMDADGKAVVQCSVEVTRSDKVAKYEFTVDRKVLKHSTFTFREMSYIVKRDNAGKETIEAMPSGDFYWIVLNDFAAKRGVGAERDPGDRGHSE